MRLTINKDPIDHSQCALSYDEAEGWLQARWSGYVNQAEAMCGAQAYLAHVAQVPSRYLINDDSRFQRPWFESLDWLGHVWVPSAGRLGLRCVAHVVQQGQHHDIFSCRPLPDLPFELPIFQAVNDARHWLRQVRNQAGSVLKKA